MRLRYAVFLAAAAAAAIAFIPARTDAGQRGHSKAPKASVPKGPKVAASTPKTHGPKTQTVRGKSPAPKATSAKSKAPGQMRKGGTDGTSAANTTSSTPTTMTTTTTWVPDADNPIATKLSTKANLLKKVEGRLPAGTDLNAATAGFKNFGQFIAAVNVSFNHQIDFEQLHAAMTGLTFDGTPTGQPTLSLGQAMHQITGVDGEAEAAAALTQANIEAGDSN